MAINKVIYGNDTLIDLTSDTVSANNLLAGETAHDRSGAAVQGAVTIPSDYAHYIEVNSGDLDDFKTPGFYLGKKDNACTNKPSGVSQFGLLVIKTATSNYGIYKQILWKPNTSSDNFVAYSRIGYNNTWNSWIQITDMTADDKTKLDGIAAGAEVNWKEFYEYVGAKNFIPYPYSRESGYEEDGITFTYSGDGYISLDGTATDTADFRLYDYNEPTIIFETGVEYILSIDRTHDDIYSILYFKDSSGNNLTLTYDIEYEDGSSESRTTYYVSLNRNILHTTAKFKITTSNIKCISELRLRVGNGSGPFNPLTHKARLMIRLASDPDSTWKSYAQTNKELTDNKVDWSALSILGTRNLNSFPYYSTAGTTTGLTFTINDDGTIKATGKSYGGNLGFQCHAVNGSNPNKNALFLKNGTYRLKGCPTGGSTSSYYLDVGKKSGGSFVSYGKEYGDGILFTVNEQSGSAQIGLKCVVINDYQLPTDGIVFAPMITDASDLCNEYSPYAMSNANITSILGGVPDTNGTYSLKAIRGSDGSLSYSWVADT